MLKEIIGKLKKFNPKSIFVYGSNATNETNSKSDYELGLIFEKDNHTSTTEIKKEINNNKFSIFSFKYEEFINYAIDTPFEKNLYIYALISGGAKTIYGEKIIEKLPLPKISKNNLINDTYFNLGYALSSFRIFKSGNLELSSEMFYKSAFFATRNLIFAKTNKFIIGYENIYNESKKIEIPDEYRLVLDKAISLRKEQTSDIEFSYFLKNISYINKFVLQCLMSE